MVANAARTKEIFFMSLLPIVAQGKRFAPHDVPGTAPELS
jgi:hypothetical protein